MRLLLLAFAVSVVALLWAAWRIGRAIRRPVHAVTETGSTLGLREILARTQERDERDEL